MPSDPAESEKYSLDDMLERLQGRPPAEDAKGELVTRADGTQAIKVRKRKRRSKQPHKEAAKRMRRMKVVQIASLIAIVILAVLAFGGLVVYSNSAPYRAGVTAKLEAASGAKVELTQFRSNPTASNIVRVDFNWPEGNILKFLSLTGITAKAPFGGMTGRGWRADEVLSATGSLQLDTPRAGTPARITPALPGKPPVSFNRLGVNNLDVNVGDPVDPALRILGTEASFYPTSEKGPASIRLFRGDVRASGLPPLRLNRAFLEFSGKETEIVTLRLQHPTDSNGAIDLFGKLDPYASGGERVLGIRASAFALSGLTGAPLGRLISGKVDSRDAEGSNRISMTGGKSPRISIAFSAASGTPLKLNGFQFLSTLSQITGNPWFIEPVLDDACSGLYLREEGMIRLADLSFLERGHMRLEGDVTLRQKDDSLSGTLRVGLPDTVLASFKNPRLDSVFKENLEGYRWATIKLSGTSERPQDNLKDLYQAAHASSSPDTGAGGGTLFEQLTQPK